MKLLLISLIFFGPVLLPGPINAQYLPRILTISHDSWIKKKTACRTIDPKELSSSFLLVSLHNISRLDNSTGNYTLSDVTIQKSIDDNYEQHDLNYAYTYNCADNTLYILKKNSNESSADVLNVFDYNKNNGELILTKQVPTIFDGAESIQLDWLTGKIYWITHNDRRQYSIKVTDQSFERAEYVVENFAKEIYEMKIYPQRREIFFTTADKIYWTHTRPGSSANLVFESLKDTIEPGEIAIDYELEELCWTPSLRTGGGGIIRCIDIAWSSPPFDEKDVVTKHKIDPEMNTFLTRDLLVFSNEFYWIGYHLLDQNRFLFYQPANGNPVKVIELNAFLHYDFIFLNCPCTREEVSSSMGIIFMDPHVSKEYTTFY